MTKKEAAKKPTNLRLIEDVLGHENLYMDSVDPDELQRAGHVKWLRPLEKLGLIRLTRTSPAWGPDVKKPRNRQNYTYYYFDVTPEGIAWCARERVAAYDKPIDYACLVNPVNENLLEGRGIGAEIDIAAFYERHYIACIKGITEGYFEFAGYYYYWRDLMGPRLTVRLTAAGLKFFDSIPRLILECA